MAPIIVVIIALSAGMLGAAVAYLIAHSRANAVAARLDERTREADALRARAAECDAARAGVARLEAELAAEQRASAEKVALLDEAGVRLRDAFTALSADALNANNKQFLELATTSLSKFQESAQTELATREKAVADLVKPIEDSLKRVDEKLGTVEKERVDAYATLKAHVETMKESQLQLQTETHNLVRALRTPHIRGSWGEIQLRRVVEMAGMLEHCDFDEQVSTGTDDGRLRPDLVIHLPAGKTIIVDSKAPLSAYLQSVEATEEDARSTLLVQHARQVRTHITQLAGKDYSRQFESAPDFVVMFLPGESFFSAACQCDPTLIDYAVDQQRDPRESHHTHHAAAHHRVRLASGADRRERGGDQQARPGAV